MIVSAIDPQKPGQAVDVSVVIIGRNEGLRLAMCLQSVQEANWAGMTYELIYVDSMSSDGSVAMAEDRGARVIVLNDELPCAAKARNLGWRAARGHDILFLDGDTQLHPEFVSVAAARLRPQSICAVWGHRRESRPQDSIYNRVMDLDWIYPAGRTLYFGGDVLIKRQALDDVGGYDPHLKAGEEPEMCARLRAKGWEIEHIDHPMTQHDLAITSFKAYCLRAYRSGIAYAEVADRMRSMKDALWQKESRRDFWHGLIFLATPWLMLMGSGVALVVVLLGVVVIARSARRCAWKAPGQKILCWQYAIHSMVQKVPAFFGQVAWRKAKWMNRKADFLDYKNQK